MGMTQNCRANSFLGFNPAFLPQLEQVTDTFVPDSSQIAILAKVLFSAMIYF